MAKTKNKVAFVLSGGGNYGVLQVGALEYLLQQGIYPDFLVGASAGALNSVFFALDPSPDQIERMKNLWLKAKGEDAGVSSPLVTLRRMINRHPALFDAHALSLFLKKTLPPGITTFGQLKIPAYTVAVRFRDGTLKVFGDNPGDLLIDGMMASAAIPPYYSPWVVQGEEYLDGGVISNLPLLQAIQRGAGEVYALAIQESLGGISEKMDWTQILSYTISLMIKFQMEKELEEAQSRGVTLHYIPLTHEDVPFWDFKRGKELLERGKREAEEALKRN